MFSAASSFNQDLDSWQVANGVVFYGMFDYATSFNGDLSGWNLSGDRDMKYMFDHAYAFNRDISSWNVHGVINMEGMFHSASSFVRPPLMIVACLLFCFPLLIMSPPLYMNMNPPCVLVSLRPEPRPVSLGRVVRGGLQPDVPLRLLLQPRHQQLEDHQRHQDAVHVPRRDGVQPGHQRT